VNSVAARRSLPSLYDVYMARVINMPAVQCHRAAATDDYKTKFLFFIAGYRPKLPGHCQWSLDAPEQDFPGAPFDLVINPISLPMQLAWNAAVVAFKELIAAIANGELIANGEHAATSVRRDLDPAEWRRTNLILDVRNGDLMEGRIEYRGKVGHRTLTVRWASITLRPAIPEQKLGRIDWDDWWKHETTRREQGSLPNKKHYLREAESLIMERYGVTAVPPSELRRIKAPLYRGDFERPKRPKRKQPRLKG
jgi:hypothetical protein